MQPSDASDAHLQLFKDCLAEATLAGRSLMEGMVNAAKMALQSRDSSARDFHERNAVAHALHLIGRHEAGLIERYPKALQAAFLEEIGTDGKAKPAPAAVSLSFDQLELMDDAQLQDSVESARAQQAALHAADIELAELNPLICAAQGYKTMRPEHNPLRPEIYVRCLQDTLAETNVTASIRVSWMQHMCAVLGKELKHQYHHVAERLREGGVQGAGYAVVQTADPGAAAAAPAAAVIPPVGAAVRPEAEASRLGRLFGGPESVLASAYIDATASELLTVEKLRSLLSGELDAAPAPAPSAMRAPAASAAPVRGARPAAPEFDQTVPAALDALQQMDQVDQAMARLAERRAAAAGGAPDTVRDELRQSARGVGQVLGLEVVGLMIDNIAHDSRLLPPVQQVVRELEPALMRLAMIDPRFFSDKEHPARRLLDELTQRSLAYESESASGFGGFLRPLQIAAGQLATSAIDSAAPFEAALESLVQLWSERARGGRLQRERAVQALLQAEQRNLLAEKIRQEFLILPGLDEVPAEIKDFLCGPWAQVVAQARLVDRSASPDPYGYAGLVPQLLWSAQPALARHNRPKLTKLIPSLLSKVREGLKTIDFPATLASAFLEKLIGLHQQAFHAPAGGATPLASAAPAPAATSPAAAAPGRTPASEPWIAPAEAAQSGFLDLPADAPAAAPAAPGSTPPGSGLALGSWVELMADGQWARTQLTWASPHGSLFLFTDAGGGTRSVTRRVLDKLLAEGGLRVVASQHVIDGALDAVAQKALRNTVDSGFAPSQPGG